MFNTFVGSLELLCYSKLELRKCQDPISYHSLLGTTADQGLLHIPFNRMKEEIGKPPACCSPRTLVQTNKHISWKFKPYC